MLGPVLAQLGHVFWTWLLGKLGCRPRQNLFAQGELEYAQLMLEEGPA